MRQNFVEELGRVAELDPRPRTHVDWARVEDRLGRRLPSDYKVFAEIFGPGHFDEYIWVAVPHGFGPRLDFFDQLQERVNLLRSLSDEGIPIPYPLYPENEGLIPWGSTIEGEALYWVTDNDDPDRWTVVLHLHRTDDWFEFQGSATHFLYSLLTGQTAVPVLPDSFGSQPHSFIRFGPTAGSAFVHDPMLSDRACRTGER